MQFSAHIHSPQKIIWNHYDPLTFYLVPLSVSITYEKNTCKTKDIPISISCTWDVFGCMFALTLVGQTYKDSLWEELFAIHRTTTL